MKKTAALIFMTIMVMLLLAACGGSSETGTPSDNGSAGGSGEASGSSGGDVIELTMTSWGNPAEIQVLQRAVDAFNDRYDDIQVELIASPGEAYDQRILTQLQGGQAPDVFYVGDGLIAQLINNNTILPLNDFLEGPDSYVAIDEFADGLWGAARRDGIVYGLTVDCNPMVMYYNKGLFEEVGVKTPQEYFDEGNWNWQAMEEITSQLKAAGKHGFVADHWWGHTFSWIWSNGGQIYDENYNVYIDEDPKALEAIQYVSRMIDEGNFVFAGTLPQGQGADAMFMSNQVGMAAAGRWWVPMFKENESLDFDMIPWPTNTGNPMEPAGIPTAYLAVNADTDHPEAAMLFASFYTSTEGQETRLAGSGNAIPSVSGIDHVVTDDDVPAHGHYLLDAREIGFANEIEAAIPGLGSEVQDQYELLFIGESDPETTLQNIGRIAREMIQEYQGN